MQRSEATESKRKQGYASESMGKHRKPRESTKELRSLAWLARFARPSIWYLHKGAKTQQNATKSSQRPPKATKVSQKHLQEPQRHPRCSQTLPKPSQEPPKPLPKPSQTLSKSSPNPSKTLPRSTKNRVALRNRFGKSFLLFFGPLRDAQDLPKPSQNTPQTLPKSMKKRNRNKHRFQIRFWSVFFDFPSQNPLIFGPIFEAFCYQLRKTRFHEN